MKLKGSITVMMAGEEVYLNYPKPQPLFTDQKLLCISFLGKNGEIHEARSNDKGSPTVHSRASLFHLYMTLSQVSTALAMFTSHSVGFLLHSFCNT